MKVRNSELETRMMETRSSELETRNKFEIRILTYRCWAFARKFPRQVRRINLKAAEDSHFVRGQVLNHTKFRISNFEFRILS
jgi:hypothetical protein